MINWLSLDALKAMAIASGAAIALAGCGGIELEGKVFDAVGLSSKSNTRAEPKLTERAPLIVPPSTAQLPQPGSNPTQVAAADASFPTNPEEIEARKKKELAAKRKEECADENGEFGSRQSGKANDFESAGKKPEKIDCSSPLKDLVGNAF